METSAKTILLVEDEALIALAETRKLNQAGYKVIHSSTGESAIAIVNENPAAIDLILMDINLGRGIDGTQAAQDILKIHDIPIVFLSSHIEPEVVKKTEEITNYGYVVKSSVFTVLDASIKMAFKLFRAKRQLDLNSMEIESTNEELRKSLTKFQNAYDRLALHETMQEKIFRLSPDAICITRVSDGVYKEVNQSFSRLFGFTREEAIGRSCFSGDMGIWIHQDERERLASRLRQDGGGISFEMDFRRRDGTTIITSTSAELIEINGEYCVISSMRDISTSKRYEGELRESEERYRILFEEAGAGILIYDRDLRILDANKKSVQMFGYSKEELLAISLRELDPDLADPARLSKLAKGIYESGPFSFAADRRLKNGMVLPVEVNAMTIVWQGKPAIMAIIHDISAQEEKEREYAKAQVTLTAHEEKLRESEERFRLAMEASKDAIWDINIGKSQVYFNPAYFALFGYGQEDASFIATWPTYFHSDEFEALSPIIGDCIENRRQAFDVDYRATLSDGLSRWLNVRGKVVERDSNGRARRLLGTIHDISERKAVEAELREKESQLKTIGDNTPAFLGILDANSLRFQYVNRMYEQSYGLTKEHMLGKTIGDIAGEANYQNAAKYLDEALRGQRATYERQFSLAWGEVWAHMDYIPQFSEDGKVERILILGVDITDLKNTAEALKKSEERFRLAMDAADEGIWDHNLLTDEIYYSPAYYKIVGHGPEEIGRPVKFNKYVHPDDRIQSISAMNDCIENLKDFVDFDYRIQTKDGTWKWMTTHGKVVERDATGKATRMIGTSRDITDRKQSEQEIRELLCEKELILREVHHRIKNNLQAVASILSIRVADSEDSSANMILNEAIGEIESMSLLYDKLYRTAYVGTIPVREYLPELLSQAAQVFGGELPLNIETEIDDFTLDAAKLSRLGIVINELVTNSLKYAFAGVASPTIKLRVLRHDLRIHLEYEDNGIGLPESFSVNSAEGFGMQLILAMMQQIGGTIQAESQGGARFTLDLDA